jgi:hypothetical protein
VIACKSAGMSLGTQKTFASVRIWPPYRACAPAGWASDRFPRAQSVQPEYLLFTTVSVLRARLMSLQIPKQPLKCLLVGPRLAPAREIADVPAATNSRRPCLLRAHDRRIEPDRK